MNFPGKQELKWSPKNKNIIMDRTELKQTVSPTSDGIKPHSIVAYQTELCHFATTVLRAN